MKKAEYHISGMFCSNCSITIENALSKEEGVSEVHVNYGGSIAYVSFDETKTDEEKILSTIAKTGYKPRLIGTKIGYEYNLMKISKEAGKLRSLLLMATIFALPSFVLGMVFAWMGIDIPNSGYILWFLATPVQFVIGWPLYRNIHHNIKNRSADMGTLIVLGTTSAYIYSLYVLFFRPHEQQYFEISTIIITIALFGEYLGAITRLKTRNTLKKLIGLPPKYATIYEDRKEKTVAIEDVKVGDVIVVKPGEMIPVDGLVIVGSSTVDESPITGESIPVEKKVYDKVFGGSTNMYGTFRFSAIKVGENMTLSKVIRVIEEAQSKKAPIQHFADKVSSYLVPAIIGFSIITFAFWYFSQGSSISFSVMAAVSVLVIACPFALGMATPIAITVGTWVGVEKGILIKGGDILEKTHLVRQVLFDKTGTITKGTPEVIDIIPLATIADSEIIKVAATIEAVSEHPFAEAVLKKAEEMNCLPDLTVTDFRTIPGKGTYASINNRKYYLGNLKLMDEFKVNVSEEITSIHSLEEEGKVLMILAEEGEEGVKAVALISVTDPIKNSTPEAIRTLRSQGIEVYMISGDNKKSAEAIAKKAGISGDHVFSEVLPEDKIDYVIKLQNNGTVAMVGDGINDAPALAQADIGIAMGSGTDIAMETSDIVLMRGDLIDATKAIKLSRMTMAKIKQNIFWAFAYNLIAVPIAAGLLYPWTGWILNPIIAGAAMALSSVSIITNSLLLRAKKL